jgi:small conductance mechanosensitive channel
MQADLVTQATALVNTFVLPFVWKLLGAAAVWVVGGWVIKLLRAGLGRTMVARKMDPTMAGYIETGANLMLKLLLFIAVLSVLGIETTSFAALLAAGGLAIGAAWSGLLANFAAGLFLMVLRPFKVGDAARRAAVLQQQPLLAGLLRYQPGDQRRGRRRGLCRARTARIRPERRRRRRPG